MNDCPRSIRWFTHPTFQAACAILSLVAIIYSAVQFYRLHPYSGMSADFYGDALLVEAIYGEPAERAGIQVGDQILAVDGRSTNWSNPTPLYPPGLAPGDTVIITIQRGEKILPCYLTIGNYLDNLPLLALGIGVYFLALCVWGIGLVLCLFTPPHSAGPRLMGLCWLVGAISAATSGPGGWATVIVSVTMYGTTAFAIALFAIAHLYFPAPSFSIKVRRRIISTFTAAALALAFITALFVLASFIPEGELPTPLGPSLVQIAKAGTYMLIHSFTIISFLLGMGFLIHSRFATRDAEIRRQVNLIIWGTALGGAPSIMVMIFDIFASPSSLFYTYASFFFFFMPLSYAYVIYQRKLVRVDFAINRFVVLFTLTLLTMAAFVLLSLGVTRVLDLPTEATFLGGVAAASASLFAPTLRHAVQRRVDRVLYGCHYDFATVTAAFSERFAQAIDRQTLTHLLAHDLAQQMGIRQAALFLAEGDVLELQSTDGQPSIFSIGDEVCQASLAAKEPVRADPLWEQHPEAQVRWQAFAWTRLFVPLVFHDRLHGLLLLSDRFFGDIYSAADTRIIAAVAHQAALACENVRLVESLRGLNRQLVRDDEAQRKQVARDLHDTALQQLFFVKQGLFRHQDTLSTQIDLLDDTIGTLRHTIRGLRSPLLDQGLHLALQSLVEEMQKVAGGSPAIALQSNVETRLGLSDEQATALYRIAQEALANALKHAQAEKVVVTLETEEDGVRLGIVDDGTGVLEEREGHYGLAGMRERAAMIGAHLDVAAVPGQGTQITVVMTY